MRSRDFYSMAEVERSKTHLRVSRGELPKNMIHLTAPERLSVIVEEVGEVAECVKIMNGLKPKKLWTPARAAIELEDELIQIAAIACDWCLVI